MWTPKGSDTNELTCRNGKTHDLECELMVCVCVCGWGAGAGGRGCVGGKVGPRGNHGHTSVFRLDSHREPMV